MGTIPGYASENSWTSSDGRAIAAVGFIAHRGERDVWAYALAIDGAVLVTGDDITTPYYGDAAQASPADVLATLATFVGAFAEANDYADRTGTTPENAELFPDVAREWADGYSEEFTSATTPMDDES